MFSFRQYGLSKISADIYDGAPLRTLAIMANIISYISFMQVIRADMTCLGFIFPELKAREIYNPDRSNQPV